MASESDFVFLCLCVCVFVIVCSSVIFFWGGNMVVPITDTIDSLSSYANKQLGSEALRSLGDDPLEVIIFPFRYRVLFLVVIVRIMQCCSKNN